MFTMNDLVRRTSISFFLDSTSNEVVVTGCCFNDVLSVAAIVSLFFFVFIFFQHLYTRSSKRGPFSFATLARALEFLLSLKERERNHITLKETLRSPYNHLRTIFDVRSTAICSRVTATFFFPHCVL